MSPLSISAPERDATAVRELARWLGDTSPVVAIEVRQVRARWPWWRRAWEAMRLLDPWWPRV